MLDWLDDKMDRSWEWCEGSFSRTLIIVYSWAFMLICPILVAILIIMEVIRGK